MAIATATITAKTGPDIPNSLIVLAGITSITIDVRRQVIQFYQGSELTGPSKEFDLSSISLITDTIAIGDHTIVIS